MSLLDTGSDITLIPARYMGNVELHSTDHALTAANGTKIAVLGEASLPFSLGKYEGVINGLVTEHVTDIILGMDWLVQHCDVWEFRHSRVRIGGTYHKLRRRLDSSIWCRSKMW